MNIRRIPIKITTLLLSLYMFLSPLDMISSINGTGTILKYLGIMLIAAFVMDYIIKNSRLNINLLVLTVLAYCMLYLITSLLSEYIVVFPNSIINLAIFYLVIIVRPITSSDYNIISFSCILGALVLSVIMIFNSSSMLYFDRVTFGFQGQYVDPNDMGANLLMPFFFCVQHIQFKKKHYIRSTFYIAILLTISYAMLITGSRGALLALLVGICVYVFGYAKVSVVKKIIYITLLSSLCIFFFLSVQDFLPQVVKTRLTLDRIIQDKGSSRLIIWGNAIDIFMNSSLFRVLFGYGYRNFPALSLNRYGVYVGTHNLYIQNLLEGGLISFLLLSRILIFNIKKAMKSENNVLLAILISILIISLSLETINKKFLWNALILASIQIINNPSMDAKK